MVLNPQMLTKLVTSTWHLYMAISSLLFWCFTTTSYSTLLGSFYSKKVALVLCVGGFSDKNRDVRIFVILHALLPVMHPFTHQSSHIMHHFTHRASLYSSRITLLIAHHFTYHTSLYSSRITLLITSYLTLLITWTLTSFVLARLFWQKHQCSG